jgi:tRNA-splicing ligase RtcB (3'-phosphate/5'-hydroxy nucleic acid ligase)
MIDELKARKNVPVKLWVPINEVESAALDQLKNVADLPQTFKHVAAMPDVHLGVGATVGTVIAMDGAIAPSAIGVDIGCGMDAIKTKIPRDQLTTEKLTEIRDAILERVPVGFNEHKSVHNTVKGYYELWADFEEIHKDLLEKKDKALTQMGTLGGGNHFIEVSYDQHNNVWIMLHSGSRNVGKCIAEYHIHVAKGLDHNRIISDRNLSTFLVGTPEFEQYFHDMEWAQRYAFLNRTRMVELIIGYLTHTFGNEIAEDVISCHHNFARKETHFDKEVIVTRKGAIRAEKGMVGIIPGAMGSKSYIVEGLGNTDSFNSAPHGAGRRMSRGAAKKKFTWDDLQKSMEGIVCNATPATIDEISGSYKPIGKVMGYAGDLVLPKYELTQLMNIKG